MAKVFIDGQEGTTGLQIHDRLKDRTDIELIEIDPELRKDPNERRKLLNMADLVILCLPDEAAREAISMVEKSNIKVIDASTAHRTSPGWVYGLPEATHSQREAIKHARFVANPGCYPTGFVLLVRPLIEKVVLDPASKISCNALSGYSGAGKKLIAVYEAPDRAADLLAPRPYALSLKHKHVPEMRAMALLHSAPLFTPTVCPFYKGMVVTVPLFLSSLKGTHTVSTVHDTLKKFYANETFVKVMPLDSDKEFEGGFLNPTSCNDTNRCELFVFGNNEQIILTARLDNLGKGASGAAVQNMNIMLGLPEDSGLSI
ncbi:MAG: N-acetyl-gamma-glutamyl-phosphate reductase [Fibrobacteres bacterium]|nr:N-acetyl-gamma-glutamyl-phosphate reductase [Fibrobacterota bacterium]